MLLDVGALRPRPPQTTLTAPRRELRSSLCARLFPLTFSTRTMNKPTNELHQSSRELYFKHSALSDLTSQINPITLFTRHVKNWQTHLSIWNISVRLTKKWPFKGTLWQLISTRLSDVTALHSRDEEEEEAEQLVPRCKTRKSNVLTDISIVQSNGGRWQLLDVEQELKLNDKLAVANLRPVIIYAQHSPTNVFSFFFKLPSSVQVASCGWKMTSVLHCETHQHQWASSSRGRSRRLFVKPSGENTVLIASNTIYLSLSPVKGSVLTCNIDKGKAAIWSAINLIEITVIKRLHKRLERSAFAEWWTNRKVTVILGDISSLSSAATLTAPLCGLCWSMQVLGLCLEEPAAS